MIINSQYSVKLKVILIVLLFTFSLSCSNNSKIVNIINKNEKELLEFKLLSQEYDFSKNFENYKTIKLKLVKEYFLYKDYQNEINEIKKIKIELDKAIIDMYLVDVRFFNEEIIKVILKKSNNNNILSKKDIEFIMDILCYCT